VQKKRRPSVHPDAAWNSEKECALMYQLFAVGETMWVHYKKGHAGNAGRILRDAFRSRC